VRWFKALSQFSLQHKIAGKKKGVFQGILLAVAKVAAAKLYDRKAPITAADLLNDRVIPLFENYFTRLRAAIASAVYRQSLVHPVHPAASSSGHGR
jgi:hypothetical protein